MSTLSPSDDYRASKISISNGMKACAVITLVLVANTAYIGVEAWGGLFNRFSPEMLSNLGYGSHGGYMNRPGLLQVSKATCPWKSNSFISRDHCNQVIIIFCKP